jgi:hypothetical protein
MRNVLGFVGRIKQAHGLVKEALPEESRRWLVQEFHILRRRFHIFHAFLLQILTAHFHSRSLELWLMRAFHLKHLTFYSKRLIVRLIN